MKRKHIILVHLIFWAVTLISIGLQVIPSIGKKTWDIIAIDYSIYIVSFVSVFYLFYFFISNQFPVKRKIVLLVLSGLLLTVILTIPVTYIYLFLLFPNVLELTEETFLLNSGKFYISFFETNFMFAVSGSLLKIALLWYENTMKQKETEKQLISGELALLRSQINPRFLLNTLTYIRSLIERSPEKAIYSIENLSEIMSYMLYETSADRVPLEAEINHMRNYLKLQEVRYTPGYITFKVAGDNFDLRVPPLLFMPFLENTFCAAQDNSLEIPGITITILTSGRNLTFAITNHITENEDRYKDQCEFSINSVKQILDLQFGDNYTLETAKEYNKNLIRFRVLLS